MPHRRRHGSYPIYGQGLPPPLRGGFGYPSFGGYGGGYGMGGLGVGMGYGPAFFPGGPLGGLGNPSFGRINQPRSAANSVVGGGYGGFYPPMNQFGGRSLPYAPSAYTVSPRKAGYYSTGGNVITTEILETAPIDGQKPGTSGLRKKVAEFEQGNYLHNFVQSIFNAIPSSELKGSTLVLGGDGRYFNSTASQIILAIAAANGVGKVLVGQNGILSTPALSNLIRSTGALGGIILTASHNPGGPTEDFGIKWNSANGGPAPEGVTDAIFAETKVINQIHIANLPDIDLSRKGSRQFTISVPSAGGENDEGFVMVGTSEAGFTVEVVDSVDAYVAMCKEIFDFGALSALLARPDFRMVFDAMNGVTGPYAKAIFIDELGGDADSVVRSVPLEDFGGAHPDPNLTYAADLVTACYSGDYEFGAASDGDGDRNMILGNNFFVSPCDSVAIIADNAVDCIPYFKSGLKGVARSMPTACALDRVAEAKGVTTYEVPTGWKFFGNLMDAGQLSICGEESFGTGSDHIREKDGIWAVLAWLSILAAKNADTPVGSLVSVADVVQAHWATYGRNVFVRYDYEGVSKEEGEAVMAHVIGQAESAKGKTIGEYTVASIDEFCYEDPVDGSVSDHQGIRVNFECGSRVVLRLSGTSSSGATIRMYLERYVESPEGVPLKASEALDSFIAAALEITDMVNLTGREKPTVET